MLIAAVVAASAAAPAFAETVHAHVWHRAAKTGAGEAGQKANGQRPPATVSHDSEPAGRSDASVPHANTVPVKNRDVNVHLNVFTPGKFDAPHAIAPVAPVIRNSIGMTVHPIVNGSDHLRPASPAGAGMPNTVPRAGETKSGPVSVPQHPIVNASAVNQGRIAGPGLIRPTPALSGLGGPAKTAVGVNGTTIHLKH
jgi:hypothetical protein